MDRPGAPLEATVRDLSESSVAIALDVRDEASVAGAFDQLDRLLGRLDILVTCAAVQLNGRDGPVHLLDVSTWNETLAVNLTGVFLCCKHAVPRLLRQGGSIIVCGSPTGLRGLATGYDAYTASKGGAMALARVLAMEYARAGIRVNTLVPGTTDTPLTHDNLVDPEIRRRLEESIPLGRIATPEDYASLAVLLASDELGYATGGEFVVDGGLLQR
jgi:NAD(P)-dependent dehydrogenase (short-subunit alcohol dehydrogenase family)